MEGDAAFSRSQEGREIRPNNLIGEWIPYLCPLALRTPSLHLLSCMSRMLGAAVRPCCGERRAGSPTYRGRVAVVGAAPFARWAKPYQLRTPRRPPFRLFPRRGRSGHENKPEARGLGIWGIS